MKLPRDVSAHDLVRQLAKLGYSVTRQKGSHLRLSTEMNGPHSITVPNHDPLKVGTLNGILKEVASQFDLDKESVVDILFDD
jgi:predicted RNA binding protein YcfA (HicA-like mRNA interferase family)